MKKNGSNIVSWRHNRSTYNLFQRCRGDTQQKYINIKLSFRDCLSYFELIWREMWGNQELVLVNKLHYYTCKPFTMYIVNVHTVCGRTVAILGVLYIVMNKYSFLWFTNWDSLLIFFHHSAEKIRFVFSWIPWQVLILFTQINV